MKAFVIVGSKHGDTASILPMLCKIHESTGKKPVVVASKKYEDLVLDCPSVTPDIYDGEWDDLRGALKYAKSKYRTVECLSTYGKNFPIEQRLPSFQLDQWDRASMVPMFGSLPLVLKEPGFHFEKKGSILLAMKSESSPFPHADDVRKIVYEMCPGRGVIDLSEIKMGKLSDFVALYDSAALLITIDTCHMHLSLASSVPVIAFAADMPSLWHGSAFHKRFSMHCRYRDFERRSEEFKECLTDVLDGKPSRKITQIEGLYYGAFNPTIAEYGSGFVVAYRYHVGLDPKTRIGIAELDEDLKVLKNYEMIVPEEMSRMSMEDPRFFMYSGRLHMSFTQAKFVNPYPKCVCCYGTVEKDSGEWRLSNVFQPAYGANNFTGMEKNWVFFEVLGKLFCDYGNGIVLEVSGSEVKGVHKSPAIGWGFGHPHGGNAINIDGKIVRTFHSRVDVKGPYGWHYRIGIGKMSDVAPFGWTDVNPRPIISGDEEYRSIGYWKRNVSFPCGAVVRGDKILISYGHNDSACRIVEIDKKEIL